MNPVNENKKTGSEMAGSDWRKAFEARTAQDYTDPILTADAGYASLVRMIRFTLSQYEQLPAQASQEERIYLAEQLTAYVGLLDIRWAALKNQTALPLQTKTTKVKDLTLALQDIPGVETYLLGFRPSESANEQAAHYIHQLGELSVHVLGVRDIQLINAIQQDSSIRAQPGSRPLAITEQLTVGTALGWLLLTGKVTSLPKELTDNQALLEEALPKGQAGLVRLEAILAPFQEGDSNGR